MKLHVKCKLKQFIGNNDVEFSLPKFMYFKVVK